jgi:ribosomal protein S18 acetylase RimI-like enzyme
MYETDVPPTVDHTVIRQLEIIGDRAWPAAEVFDHDGWELRYTGAMGRRLNSATPIAAGDLPVQDKIEFCEAFYRERAAPPLFKLTAASLPPTLDDVLAKRGYVIDAPTAVHAAPIRPAPAPGDVIIHEAPGPAWIQANARLGGHAAGWTDLFEDLVDRIRLPAAYAAIGDDHIAGNGMAVLDADYLVLFEIVTDPAKRRQGLARRIVTALLGWGAANGATTALLQVMTDNLPALRLYEGFGFSEAYRYWYRLG